MFVSVMTCRLQFLCRTANSAVNMEDNSVNFAKMARLLAFIHIITGVLFLGFGVADKLEGSGAGYHGIWIAIWLCITGCLGVPASGRKRTTFSNALAGVFMGFSMISAVVGGIIVIIYSVEIFFIISYGFQTNDNYGAKLAIIITMLILGIATFWFGISAALCSCLLKPCSGQRQGWQRIYYNSANRYVMTQLPGGFPVPIPMQAVGGGAEAQGYHQSIVQVPVSGVSEGQHDIVQAASPEGMTTSTTKQQFEPHLVNISSPCAKSDTDSSLFQKAEMPGSFEHGSYTTLQNEQIDA